MDFSAEKPPAFYRAQALMENITYLKRADERLWPMIPRNGQEFRCRIGRLQNSPTEVSGFAYKD